MIHIHYNQAEIRLLHLNFDRLLPAKANHVLKLYYRGNTKALLSILDQIEKSDDLTDIYILTTDVKQLKRDFFGLFRIIEASGGLVVNRNAEVLMIFRRGHWDLPKGKIDKGETKKEAAIREVQEETGIDNVGVVKKIGITHHIYRTPEDGRVLKPSYWYLMCSPDMELIPQFTEDIEKAIWVPSDQRLLQDYTPIYPSIRIMLKQYLSVLNDLDHAKS